MTTKEAIECGYTKFPESLILDDLGTGEYIDENADKRREYIQGLLEGSEL